MARESTSDTPAATPDPPATAAPRPGKVAVATIRDNTADVTTHPIARANARHLRLDIITPTQDTDRAARIYELEAF